MTDLIELLSSVCHQMLLHVLACGTGEGSGIAFAHYRICQFTSVLSEVKSTHVNHCHHSADMQ